MQGKKFLISGVIIILGITALGFYILAKMKNDIPAVCRANIFSIRTYTEGYNVDNTTRKVFIKTQDDLDNLLGTFKTEDLQSLNIKEHDYLIYFLDKHTGCDRIERVNCIKLEKNDITIKMDKYEANTSCNIIFRDAIIIDLEKNMYDKDIEVKIEE